MPGSGRIIFHAMNERIVENRYQPPLLDRIDVEVEAGFAVTGATSRGSTVAIGTAPRGTNKGPTDDKEKMEHCGVHDFAGRRL